MIWTSPLGIPDLKISFYDNIYTLYVIFWNIWTFALQYPIQWYITELFYLKYTTYTFTYILIQSINFVITGLCIAYSTLLLLNNTEWWTGVIVVVRSLVSLASITCFLLLCERYNGMTNMMWYDKHDLPQDDIFH